MLSHDLDFFEIEKLISQFSENRIQKRLSATKAVVVVKLLFDTQLLEQRSVHER